MKVETAYDSIAVPPDIYGRFRRDPAIVVVDAVMAPAIKAMGRLLKQPAQPVSIDRSLRLTVRKRQLETADGEVVSLELADPHGTQLPRWTAGAHIDLTLPSGSVRQYSLCGDPHHRNKYRIAVRRIHNGNASAEVHDSVRLGDQLLVNGPRNAFPLAAGTDGVGERRLHFVAGGIGITPILSMLRAADGLGVAWTMVYAGRSRASLPFLDELSRYGDRVTVRTDEEHGLPSAADLLPPPDSDAAVYCCGPSPMLDAIRAELVNRPFHFERFSAAPIVDGVPFDVQLGAGGEVLHVPADRSALETIRSVRPAIAYSCQQGFCGTCRVKVSAGSQESDDMLICVDRADGGTLILDI